MREGKKEDRQMRKIKKKEGMRKEKKERRKE